MKHFRDWGQFVPVEIGTGPRTEESHPMLSEVGRAGTSYLPTMHHSLTGQCPYQFGWGGGCAGRPEWPRLGTTIKQRKNLHGAHF